jgi:hypothetical protein
VRHRATIDLRGIEVRLRAFAAAGKLTIAASVRRAIDAMLAGEGQGTDDLTANARMGAVSREVKVTIRMSATHLQLLAMRARRADVSQGAYVASLIDGTPLAPRPADHREALQALSRSTSELASLSIDLHASVRRLRGGGAGEDDPQLVAMRHVETVVSEHVRLASRLMADVDLRRHAPGVARGGRSGHQQQP